MGVFAIGIELVLADRQKGIDELLPKGVQSAA